MNDATTTDWLILRSNIYLRDKGMCWVCNTFVNLDEYDLGHLIDRCNGGHDAYDNLTVMHKSCNLSKPRHETLEEAMKWKLTAFIPFRRISKPSRTMLRKARKQQRQETRIVFVEPRKDKPLKKKQTKINHRELLRRDKLHQEQLARIKPSTIVWLQGSPQGGKMWKVLPPPYQRWNIFSMRQLPPGAIDYDVDTCYSCDTIQVIGGKLIEDVDIEINSGIVKCHITSINGIPSITFGSSSKSNIGERSQTIGMGKGQIPIESWNSAKEQGISLNDFKYAYSNRENATPDA